MNSDPILAVQGVVKNFRLGKTEFSALRGVTFEISKGEMVGLYGRSGSGKTTLLNIMGLVDQADEGKVDFMGRNVGGLRDSELAKIRNQSIGFIFQGFNLVPVFDAFENVEYPMILGTYTRGERKRRVEGLMEAVGMENHMRHRPDELSGGQRQRVAIARALVNKPALVFADEATSALDKRTSIEVMDLCKRINEETGTAFIFSSHDDIVASYCSRLIKISDGEIEKGGVR